MWITTAMFVILFRMGFTLGVFFFMTVTVCAHAFFAEDTYMGFFAMFVLLFMTVFGFFGCQSFTRILTLFVMPVCIFTEGQHLDSIADHHRGLDGGVSDEITEESFQTATIHQDHICIRDTGDISGGGSKGMDIRIRRDKRLYDDPIPANIAGNIRDDAGGSDDRKGFILSLHQPYREQGENEYNQTDIALHASLTTL
jgi:hypothetical protein